MCKRILLVEDDPDLRLMISEFLSLEGFEVEEAEDGADALSKLDPERQPDLVILDLMMPGYDGRYFLDHLADRVPRPGPPILISTAAPQKAPPGYRLLPKPSNIETLLSTVQEMTG